ncbi:hypothetical protein NP493_43g06009 [Ridgeia piscesae]|uniref:Methyltransferase domain-containing protein n=1 Tax=Ridgeia piscesae TaxID=27915 RepID=A0AAD9UJJ7_RIDPI|nr:hypothetical protein NP493_43g06009 [Ridgeia piscesae]
MRKGMNPKKIHEVSQMAAVVDKLCKECAVRHIVDIGSGLGYLGQVLSADYGYRVLGLEGVNTRTHSAEQQVRKKELSNTDFRSVTFTLCDTDECFTEFHQMLHNELLDEECLKGDKSLVEEASQSQQEQNMTQKALEPGITDKSQGPQGMPLCMMGLHCCGDLTPTMLRLLTRTTDIDCLVCVGCCYHNMTCTDSQEYKSFPMSSKLRAVMKHAQEKHPEWHLNTFALRLAAQETRARWQRQTSADHEYHVKNVAFRGIVELFCQTEDSVLTKTRRRVARRKDYDTFDTYLAAVFDRTTLSGNQDMALVLNKLQHLYSSHTPDMVFIEPFTALQVALQPVLESLVVLDRLQFLHEHDISATAVPIFDDEISPRNLALVGWKHTRNS